MGSGTQGPPRANVIVGNGMDAQPVSGYLQQCTVVSDQSAIGSVNPFGRNQSGICLQSPFECRNMGGKLMGTCYGKAGQAMMYGACCLFETTCGQTAFLNGTYFRNPGSPNPSSEAGACSLAVKSAYPNICQLRLDFVTFNLKQPNQGNCDQDRFIVSGQSSDDIIPPLCGYNPGQHMYIDLDDQAMQNPAATLVNLNVITTGSRNRWFDIKISYIPCNSPFKAPRNCLQYHYALNGRIKSFNFDTFEQGFTYLNNLDYTICFARPSGFCSASYSVPLEDEDRTDRSETYPLITDIGSGSGNNGNDNRNRINDRGTGRDISTARKLFFDIHTGSKDGTSGQGGLRCPSDHLMLKHVRFCGTKLNSDLYSNSMTNEQTTVVDTSSGPLFARFYSDETGVGKGFLINYQMNPCIRSG
ncbi:hypothetical protein HDE_13160 [Halotydeus destructor]|nr:hypothetical protein HDE_13160 [Halotydeus destructor]